MLKTLLSHVMFMHMVKPLIVDFGSKSTSSRGRFFYAHLPCISWFFLHLAPEWLHSDPCCQNEECTWKVKVRQFPIWNWIRRSCPVTSVTTCLEQEVKSICLMVQVCSWIHPFCQPLVGDTHTCYPYIYIYIYGSFIYIPLPWRSQ